MAKFGSEFVGQYSLSKTLRFELKPIGKTLETMKQNDFLQHDETRHDNYVLLKKVLDDYYRYFIEQVLKNKVIDADLIEKIFNAYVAGDSAECEKNNKVLRTLVAKLFDVKDQYGLKDYKDLIKVEEKIKDAAGNKKTVPSMFINWINGNANYTAEQKKQYVSAVATFDGFVTYFAGFKDNRENMFSADDKVTAISNRIVNENMYRYFDNVKNYYNIEKKYPDLCKQLDKWKDSFVPGNYGKILAQSAIDDYNYGVIGRSIEDVNAKGVNSLINEYRQKNGIKARELPMMVVLYKQILSDRETVLFDVIESDNDAVALAKDNYDKLVGLVNAAKALVSDNVDVGKIEGIYVKESELTTISKELFGEWGYIRNAINWQEQLLPAKKIKAFKEKFSKVVALGDLCSVISTYRDAADSEITDKKNVEELLVGYLNTPPNFQAEIDKIPTDKVVNFKDVLDKMNEVVRFYKALYLYDGTRKILIQGRNEAFYNDFDVIYTQMQEISRDYDKIRNFATKKSFSSDKMKLNFDMPTLLAGWDKNKEESNHSLLFVKDDMYYLGIMCSDFSKMFNAEDETVKGKMSASGDKYRKLEYKQVSGANKMLPKVFFSRSNTFFGKKYDNFFAPSDRLEKIKEEKLYTKEAGDRQCLKEWIDFCKQSIAKHPEWSQSFDFQFTDTDKYLTVNEFYNEFDNQAYKMSFMDVAASYIDELVDQGKLCLFQIYNKDFSTMKAKKGTDNLHTLYWKALFSPKNIQNVDGPIIKLNGEAEIFWRKASLPAKITHPKNQAITNKNILNPKKESQFSYDLIKDRRYTMDKFFFHVPITLNFRGSNMSASALNYKVNTFVQNNNDIHIIGIDRGERHLLYYTVIDLQGNIVEQGSLNTISSQYKGKNNELIDSKVDYHNLLDRKEKERQDARLSWETIENIKELKSGYLSQVVHKLALLIDQYNAVVVLENLNPGFKRSRIKVERQVYQKFEKALIEKLNYLVFKDRKYSENGSFAKGYQLTAPFDSFAKLGKQSGILYYVDPSYTSHICPRTGFVNYINNHLKYTNVATAQALFGLFDGFKFNNAKGYFEVVLDYNKFIKGDVDMGKWCVCTQGTERYGYDAKNRTAVVHDVTAEMRKLFDDHNIDYVGGDDLLQQIIAQDDKAFFNTLLYLLRLTMQLRYTKSSESGNEDDYILSPVADEDGNFFDSRNAKKTEPGNADANGAYHIALKGLQLLQGIDENGKLAQVKKGTGTAEWFKFAREKAYRR